VLIKSQASCEIGAGRLTGRRPRAWRHAGAQLTGRRPRAWLHAAAQLTGHRPRAWLHAAAQLLGRTHLALGGRGALGGRPPLPLGIIVQSSCGVGATGGHEPSVGRVNACCWGQWSLRRARGTRIAWGVDPDLAHAAPHSRPGLHSKHACPLHARSPCNLARPREAARSQPLDALAPSLLQAVFPGGDSWLGRRCFTRCCCCRYPARYCEDPGQRPAAKRDGAALMQKR
jgi:hypothetical protein